MYNNIMAAGSRDRPPMLATGRYPQWRSPFLRYIDTRPNGEAVRKCILSGPYKPTTVLVQAVEATNDSPAIPKHTTVETPMNMKCGKLSKGYNKRTVNVAGAREKVGSPVVQRSWIQCFNCKEYEHFSKECRKPKRVKDFAYHKEKMLLCKQAEQGVPLQAEQYDWLADTDEEVDEKELEAHYSYIAKIQETKQAEFEKYKAFNDRTVDYDKLECKLNETLGQLALKDIEIKEGLKTKAYEILVVKQKHDELMKQSLLTKSYYECLVKQKTKYVESIEKKIDELESDKVEFANMYNVILQECVSKDVMCTYLQSLSDLDALDELQCLYLHKVKECDCLAQKLSKQTEFVSKKVHNELLQRFAKVDKHSISLEIALQKCKEQKLIEKGKGKYVATKFDISSVVRQPNAQRIPKPSVLGKPTPFSDSLERRYFPKTKSVPKTNVSKGLSKPVTVQTLPQMAGKAVRLNHNTNVSRPQCKSNQLKDKVLPNNSQVKVKKTQVEVHPRIPSVSNKIKVYYIEGLNHNLFSVGQFCDADLEVAFRKSTCFVRDLQGNDLLTGNRRSDLYTISLQESTSSTPLCLMAKSTPTQAWLWHRRLSHLNFDYINLLSKKDIVIGLPKLKYVKDQLCSSCELSKAKRSSFKSKVVPSSKGRLNLLHVDLCDPMLVASINRKKYILHMTGNLRLLCNFVEKFMGTVRFGNDQFVPILGYGDLVQGNVTINRVYYVEGLNHNLFSVGQFYDADLEVAFRKLICFVRDLQGNDLLTGNRGADLYTISLQESTSSTPLCLMAKSTPTQAWLWHQRLSHLNFDYINLLSNKDIMIGLPKLNINGKKYILVIVDDYSRYTWTLFLRSKDETPEVLKDFLTMIQRNLQAPVNTVRIDRGTEFLNKTLNAFFKEEGIEHQTSTARTPEQNSVVKRRNHKIKEKGDQCILVGYSTESKGYRVYNKRTRMIVESIHICFDEIKEVSETSVANDTSGLVPQRQKASDYDNPDLVPQRQDVSSSADIDSTSAPSTHTNVHAEENNNDQAEEGEQLQDDEFTNLFCAPTQEVVESSSHNIEQVRGNPSRPVQTRRQLVTDPEMCMYALTVSTAEPKNIKEAMVDSAWIKAMQDELHQFDRLWVWELVDKPFGKSIIRLKWLWKNKKDEDQTEEVYVAQPDGFVEPDHPEKVYHLRKALYGLKQAPRIHQSLRGNFINQAKYTLEILYKHGMDKGQSIGTPMATKPKLDADLSGNPADQTDYRSKIGSLMYLTSSRPDIVQAVCFCARYQSRPTIKHLKEVKSVFKYLRGTVNMGLWYLKGSSFELPAFSDADHTGCFNSRKSTSGGIQFLSDKLVSWMSKKQNCTAMSSAEAEYVALSASCAQVMWMRTQLQDYGFNYNKIPLYCDSQSAISISCNPVQHFRTKHIYTRYHFIKEQVKNGIIELYFVRTEYQLANMFTKALPEDWFKYLVRRIGMRCLTLVELEVLAKESA
nr:hypothetical protein [Tanacetum cinerariifolium]